MDETRWLPHIDRQTCTGCGDCVTACPSGVIELVDGKAALVRPAACTYSAACEAVCPAEAIALPYQVCTITPARPPEAAARFTGFHRQQGLPMTAYTYFPSLIESLPDIPPDSIVSRTLHADDDVKAVLFGFAPGQELSEHTASMPATLIILEGDADVTLGGDHVAGHAGTWIHMPPHMPHSIAAKTRLVMLLLMVRAAATKEVPAD